MPRTMCCGWSHKPGMPGRAPGGSCSPSLLVLGGQAALVAVVFVVVLQQGGISSPQSLVPSQEGWRLAPTLPQMCCVAWAQLCRACLHHLNSFLAGIEDATRHPLSLLQTEPALCPQPPLLSSLVALHWTHPLVLGAQNRMIQSLDGVSLGLS